MPDIGILLLGGLSVYIILATGQLSLGNAAFMAIGAYVASYLTVKAALPITLALLAAAMVSGALGVLVGISCAASARHLSRHGDAWLRRDGAQLLSEFRADGRFGGFHGMPHISAGYIWSWAAAVLAVVMIIERSRIWLEMRAIDDDEGVAELVGLNTTQ